MGKIDGELKVMVGLMQKMIMNGTNNDDMNCIKDYISKLYEANMAYKTNNIHHLKKKYSLIDDTAIDIPPTIKRKAIVESKNFMDSLVKGVRTND